MSSRRLVHGLVRLCCQTPGLRELAGHTLGRRNTEPWIHNTPSCGNPSSTIGRRHAHVSIDEARKLLSTLQLEDSKKDQLPGGLDCMLLDEFLQLCRHRGMSDDETRQLLKTLDECGVILIFHNRIFLRPCQVVQALANVLPVCLASAEDLRRDELAVMEKEKAQIDRIAQRGARIFQWVGFACLTVPTVACFRLTFWELSWDIMEPITYYCTYSTLLLGYLIFMATSKDPSYEGLIKSFFRFRQERLMKKRNFNIQRYKELQMQCNPRWKTHPSNDVLTLPTDSHSDL